MIYTSGTTGRPKGAVHTHRSLAAMVDGMIGAGVVGADRTVLVLPLNHVHGLINVTFTALAVGACCEAPGGFDASSVWERFGSGDVTVFMAVPTVYARLTAAWESADEGLVPAGRRGRNPADGVGIGRSGVHARGVAPADRHTLLERYGMTELHGPVQHARASSARARRGADAGRRRARSTRPGPTSPTATGELLGRGSQVFAGYWQRPEATAEAFVDGWFRTGDVGVHEAGGYRLLGRSSVDIIKTGGEKVSALEIEETYRTHPDISDAVVGVDDVEWGQRVARRRAGAPRCATRRHARSWGKERLAAAKVPTRPPSSTSSPNTLGKVVKSEVVKLFGESGSARHPRTGRCAASTMNLVPFVHIRPPKQPSARNQELLDRWDRHTHLAIVLAALLPIVLGLSRASEDSGINIAVNVVAWLVFVADLVVRVKLLPVYLKTGVGLFDLMIVVITAPWFLIPGFWRFSGARPRLARPTGPVARRQSGARKVLQRLGQVGTFAAAMLLLASWIAYRRESHEPGLRDVRRLPVVGHRH